MDYDDNEFEESMDNQPGLIDSASQSATHVAGRTAADAMAPGIGGKIYEAASNTELGRAIEEKVAKRFSFKIKLIIGCTCFLFFLLFFIIFAVVISDESSSDGDSSTCTTLPAIDNVCSSITPSGHATMSVDEYVAGVVSAEVGGLIDDDLNTYKAASIAARSYALANATKDGNGNCSVPVGTSFQAFEETSDESIISAVNDTSGMVLIKDNSIYSSQYDALCIESEDSINYYLCQGGEGEEHLMVPRTWLESKWNSKYISDTRKNVHGNGMSQNGAWYLATDRGWDFTKILNYFYGDEGVTLASLGTEQTTCSSGGSSGSSGCYNGLDDYPLLGGNATKLDTTLNTVLNSSQIEEINNSIINSIESAGYGTGGAVAAAATAFIMGLYDNGYYLPYYYGGGHSGYTGDSDNHLTIGINSVFGKTTTSTGESTMRNKLSLDCSGFVSWAIKNAVKSDFSDASSGAFVSFGKIISFSDVTPGDVFANSGHIILVVKNNGDGTVITAESTGSGIIFNSVTASAVSQYSIVDMDDYYASIKDDVDPYGGTGGSCSNN